jgi:hypothetical protein
VIKDKKENKSDYYPCGLKEYKPIGLAVKVI